MTEENKGSAGVISELRIKDKAPQTPEVPWDHWLGNLRDKFKFWVQEEEDQSPDEWPRRMPNFPEQHRKVYYEIPDKYSTDILETNQRIREIKGENTTGVFYRPGIGFGGALDEILEKIGTYGTMIVSDPVYEGKEMIDWSKGLLPIDYYLKTLATIDAKDVSVSLTDDYKKEGKILDPQDYESAEIPKGGMATIEVRINGVNLTLQILAEDMTKFYPDKYSMLALGRPTPYNPEKTDDPRYGNHGFRVRAMKSLAMDGILDYRQGSFSFLPSALPSEVFGFKIVYSKDGRVIAKKTEDAGDRLESAFAAVNNIHEALGALAGFLPGERVIPGYYKNINKYREEGKKVTLDDVIAAYRQNLSEVADFIKTLPLEIQEKALKRLEFLFVNPIATDGKLDEEKVTKVQDIGDDPDDPSTQRHEPYFGRPDGLIADHNEGNLDIFEYYNELIREFYGIFPNVRS